jgi:hypothetical protein
MRYGEKNKFIVFSWGDNSLVGRFASYEDAVDYLIKYKKTYEVWKVYQEVPF